MRRLVAPSENSGVVRANGTTSLASGVTWPCWIDTWHQSARLDGYVSSVGTFGAQVALVGPEPELEPQPTDTISVLARASHRAFAITCTSLRAPGREPPAGRAGCS